MKLKYICQYCNKELTRKDGLISHENKCISRIRWKNYIKLSFEEKEKFINNLLIEINI